MTTKHTPVTHDEARKILSRYNQSHWWPQIVTGNGERARYSIPCDPERDDDCKMGRYIEQNRSRDNALAGMDPSKLAGLIEAVEHAAAVFDEWSMPTPAEHLRAALAALKETTHAE